MTDTFSIHYFKILYNLLLLLTYLRFSNHQFSIKRNKYPFFQCYTLLILMHVILAILSLPLLYLIIPFAYVGFNSLSYHVKIKDNIKQTLLFSGIYMCCFIILNWVTSLLITNTLISNYEFFSNLKQLFFFVLLYIGFVIITNHKKNSSYNPYKKYMYIVFGVKTLLIGSIIYSYVNYEKEMSSIGTVILVILLINIIIITLITLIYEKIIEMMKANAQEHLNLQMYQLNQTFYDQLNMKVDDLRSLKHDFKNHLGIIKTSLEKENYDHAMNYINSLYQFTESANDIVVTNNHIVSSLLQTKRSECNQLGIELLLNIDFSQIHTINDMDILILLSNILDNAIQATKDTASKYITFSINQIKSYLTITCINTYAKMPIIHNGTFLSIKKDNLPHGIGTESIRKTCEKYNGEYHYRFTEKEFTIHVSVPNYQPMKNIVK